MSCDGNENVEHDCYGAVNDDDFSTGSQLAEAPHLLLTIGTHLRIVDGYDDGTALAPRFQQVFLLSKLHAESTGGGNTLCGRPLVTRQRTFPAVGAIK